MPKITALIHTHEDADAQRLARTLDSLRPCDEVLVINYAGDAVDKAVRDHGGKCKPAVPGVSPGTYLVDARNDWILCLLPGESLSEGVEASLFEWKGADHEDAAAFSVPLRADSDAGWKQLSPETRLVNRNKLNWTGELPPNDSQAQLLEGDLLRISNP